MLTLRCFHLFLAAHIVGAWTVIPIKALLKQKVELRTGMMPNDNDSVPADASSRNQQPLLAMLRPSAACTPSQMSGTHLAYIGDSVYELFIRSKLIWPAKKTSAMQLKAVSVVNGRFLFIGTTEYSNCAP